MTSRAGSRRVERLWYGDSPLAMLLQPLAWVFSAVTALRRHAYERGWLKSRHVGVPVIVVGNITVGGTGKTPVVAWLVRRLQAEGRRPAIVSRGYGGKAHSTPVRVTADSMAADVGDEPLLLWRQTGAPVAVCTDRVSAARYLVAAGVDVIVADDGLQHYALARDLEIVVLDGSRRLGNGRLLPAGPLREPARRLRKAGLIMVNGGPARQGELGFSLRGTVAVSLDGSERRDLASFDDREVWAVAGIGNPERFYEELRRHGARPTTIDVPDHGVVDLAQLRSKADWPIQMTEKDAVKYRPASVSDAWSVPVAVDMKPEVEAALMSRVRDVLAGVGADPAAQGAARASS
jgi:tetraacyldisaccharide 4'-kinase